MKRKSNNHLAEGEATGHFHEAVGAGVAVYENEDGTIFYILLTQPLANYEDETMMVA